MTASIIFKMILSLFIWGSVIFLITSFIFLKYILLPYRRRSHQLSIDELFTILQFYISTEIELYENDIFNGMENGILTNAQFENFYNDIVQNTVNSIPSTFIDKFDGSITEEYIVSIIARNTKIYLQSKIRDVDANIAYQEFKEINQK